MAARKPMPVFSDVPACQPTPKAGFWQHAIQPIFIGIAQLWCQLFARNTEPKVWETHDRDGHPIWHVYDPITGYAATVHSEQEVMAWIEERYYYHRGLI
ncbi:hypothetical protein [Geitlerinema sp. PCC 9228]|jgi:hypothetical protein|uniref:hypothetical protein n=1 Tax=Geitlerinema sp. PCC 9228 TaxID=111611 RepID=UPI0008F9E3A8|nr:hypothetical protein [Geitlerinema sp. PCC 9228]